MKILHKMIVFQIRLNEFQIIRVRIGNFQFLPATFGEEIDDRFCRLFESIDANVSRSPNYIN